MPTTFSPVIGISKEIAAQTCNCHYPVGLVIFLVFTVLSLLFCICVCCFDISQCTKCHKGSPRRMDFRRSSMNARFVEPSKFVIDRKMSVVEPCYLDYKQLYNSESVSSSVKPQYIDNGYFTDRSLVSLV